MEEAHGNHVPLLCQLHEILLPGSMGDNVSGAKESMYITESTLMCYGERFIPPSPYGYSCLSQGEKVSGERYARLDSSNKVAETCFQG